MWESQGAPPQLSFRLPDTVAHSLQSVSLKVWQGETDRWLLQQHSQKLWPCVTSDPCVPALSHLSLRLQRSASNWPTSEPADGTSSEWLPSTFTGPAGLLPLASTSAPPEVGYVCVWQSVGVGCVCVWPLLSISSCVTLYPSICYSQGLWTGGDFGTIHYSLICLSNGQFPHFVHGQIVFFACLCVCVTFAWNSINPAVRETPTLQWRNICSRAGIFCKITPVMLTFIKSK